MIRQQENDTASGQFSPNNFDNKLTAPAPASIHKKLTPDIQQFGDQDGILTASDKMAFNSTNYTASHPRAIEGKQRVKGQGSSNYVDDGNQNNFSSILEVQTQESIMNKTADPQVESLVLGMTSDKIIEEQAS
jgi:hypothetical protein